MHVVSTGDMYMTAICGAHMEVYYETKCLDLITLFHNARVFSPLGIYTVKYENTLRRFNVLPNGNGSLDLDMAGLRAKIFHLFKFTPDADVTLTYADEDDDMVNLVDNADLRDAIKQRLNPLRIVVLLTGKIDTMSGISICRGSHMVPPGLSPKQQSSFSLISSKTSYDVPEELQLRNLVFDLASIAASADRKQYQNFISKLSHDMSKAIPPPAPLLSEVVQFISTFGIPSQDPVSKQIIDVNAGPVDSSVPKLHHKMANGAPTISELICHENAIEKSLLKELEDMGFKNTILNQAVLVVNDYDMGLALDYLRTVTGQEPIVEDNAGIGNL
ncbi:hypothetical protein AQUCO_00200225v1 [Aquilegia coerulea]|uniref:PB1 domain-containing protein n=1 Tax=Aquilegia coerulea TaxID=218851 RepID=A0A2G5F243_AQUCA|nr:hypothetical protein AQUCO_00200225v1 [Aquilegia coerulea]